MGVVWERGDRRKAQDVARHESEARVCVSGKRHSGVRTAPARSSWRRRPPCDRHGRGRCEKREREWGAWNQARSVDSAGGPRDTMSSASSDALEVSARVDEQEWILQVCAFKTKRERRSRGSYNRNQSAHSACSKSCSPPHSCHMRLCRSKGAAAPNLAPMRRAFARAEAVLAHLVVAREWVAVDGVDIDDMVCCGAAGVRQGEGGEGQRSAARRG